MEADHVYSEKLVAAASSHSANLNNLSSSNVDDIFGTAGAASRPTTATAVSKGAFDDLDDDFEGLEDAKEGSADDDFANISRSGLDDFNPVFNSSPPPSQPKSESANTGAPFGVESSFDFGSLSASSAAGSAAGLASTATAATPSSQTKMPSPPAPQSTAESHDWDAIFAGLDETPTASSQTLATTTDGNGKNGSPAGNGNGSAAEAGQRPGAPGRALTEEGEHDDPILKNLTSMGYSRQDAVAALEKYDYNLERVSKTSAPAPAAGGVRLNGW